MTDENTPLPGVNSPGDFSDDANGGGQKAESLTGSDEGGTDMASDEDDADTELDENESGMEDGEDEGSTQNEGSDDHLKEDQKSAY